MMSILVQQKKRGRPASGTDPMVGVRMPPELRQAVDDWAAAQPDKPSRSEAIRLLVSDGLKAGGYLARAADVDEALRPDELNSANDG